ncbi:hypothetical protein TNCV_1593071 [Trichonephila clavipes]|nr:hypothetical protein TNCV_1593071 [Trichonephila clavipes]
MYNKLLLYTAVLRPILTYGSPVWGYAADSNIKTLEVAQNSIIRNIPIECLLSQCHGPTTAKPFRHHIDFPAKTVWKKILDLVATPPCHLRSTNKDTLTQAGPFTQGLNYKLDMGWRGTLRVPFPSDIQR